MTDTQIVMIEKLVYGGEGLAHLADGRAAFVPFVLPGESVRIAITEEKPRFARALPKEVISPSPMRIAPRCPHFGMCGGCHYQHIPYQMQLEAKLDVLRDQLERIGYIKTPPLSEIIASEYAWNYRNHVQFHPVEDGTLGFKDITGAAILPIRECHLPQAEINAIWPQIALEPGANIKRLSLRQDSFGEVMLLFEGEDQTPPELSLDLPVSACYLNALGETFNMAGEDALIYQIKERTLRVSPESFFQIHNSQAERLIDTLLENLPLDGKELEILELYSGVGLFSAFLAPHARQLTAVESSTSACYDFAINLDAFNNVSLYEAPVGQVFGGLEIKPDLVVLDPPRTGLDKFAREQLLKLESPHVIYISCDPATLSRDLRCFLEAGYKLDKIQAFDLFPQTYHVESISILSKKH